MNRLLTVTCAIALLASLGANAIAWMQLRPKPFGGGLPTNAASTIATAECAINGDYSWGLILADQPLARRCTEVWQADPSLLIPYRYRSLQPVAWGAQ